MSLSIKRLFSDKQSVRQKIILIEDDYIISSDSDVAEKMNDIFINVIANLNIEDHFVGNVLNDANTGVANAIKKKLKITRVF